MKKRLLGLSAGFVILSFLFCGIFPSQATNVLTRRLIGVEDINFATGNTDAAETFTHETAAGRTITLTKIDATHIKFRSAPGSVEDLISASTPTDLSVEDLTASGTVKFTGMSTAGFVKNAADGTLSGGNSVTEDVMLLTGDQTAAGVKTFSSIPVGPASNPTTDNQLARKAYVDSKVSLTGDETVAGVKTFSSFSITPSSAPTTDYQAANKKYVDDQISASARTKIAVLRDVKTSGTAGGSYTAGSWVTRTLQTETDPDSIVTLSSNQFTLAAGEYFIAGVASAYDVDSAQVRLANITDGTYTYGLNAGSTPASIGHNPRVSVRSTLAAEKVFALQFRAENTNGTDGLGRATSWGDEVYAEVIITKLSD